MEPQEIPDVNPEEKPEESPKASPSPSSLANLKPGGWNKGIPGTGGKKSAGEGIPRFLAAMYSVAEQEPEEDRGVWEKRARKLLERDDAAFDRRLMELEKAYLAGRSKAGTTASSGQPATAAVNSIVWDGKGLCPTCQRPPVKVDEGSERAKELCRRLMESDPPK